MTKSKLNMDVIADRILWIRRMTAPLRHLAAFVRNGWPESSEYAVLEFRDMNQFSGIGIVSQKFS